MNLYFDNAATSFPKPQQVYDSVMDYMTNIGTNPGRGAYDTSLRADRLIYSTRETLAEFFNFDKPENVIFTLNITHALNILIKGIIKSGWHVITSSMEHNSVLRPLHKLKQTVDYELDILNCSEQGFINPEDIKKNIKHNTKLIILSHASNVTGSIQPLEEIGALCKQHNIIFIIDAAQSAGSFEVDFNALNCSALAFTGHKGLLGPQGVGGFLIHDSIVEMVESLYEGGTGSVSHSLTHPDNLPDKYECGTLNAPAIAGLLSGLKFIKKEGLLNITSQELLLTEHLIEGLLNIDGITLYGNKDLKNRTSVVSIKHEYIDPSQLSFILNKEFGIMSRSGLHCAPLAHKTINSFPSGTLRLSLGPLHEINDIDFLLNSLNSSLKQFRFR